MGIFLSLYYIVESPSIRAPLQKPLDSRLLFLNF